MKLIDKDKVMSMLSNKIAHIKLDMKCGFLNKRKGTEKILILKHIISCIDILEVRDHYEQCVQHDSIKSGIQAHADTYSFNIESALFNQLTKEQQKLWRKEIEQAVISGGEVGVELARDARYKENLEVKEVDLQKEIDKEWKKCNPIDEGMGVESAFIHIEAFDMIAKHFFELGLKANQENNVIGTLEREVKIDAGGYPYIDRCIELYDYDKDIPLAKKGDKVKVIVIKEE